MGTHIPPLVCSLTVHQRAKLLIVKPIMASASTSTGAAKPSNPVLRRTVTSTTVNDSESSAAVSPSDSPRQSASSTSLSSMSSVDMGASKANNEYANLVDLNGNSFTPPDYTIKDIRDAIPKHCFERSAIRGWSYILRDMACLATTFYLFNTFNTPEYVPNVAARALLWALYTLSMLIGQQLIGWPHSLITNVTGHNFHERQREGRGKGKKNGVGGGVNHFNPSSPLYEQKDAKLIVLSDIGIALNAAVQIYLGNAFGWANMAVWFWVPWLWVNHWLVAITFLQHTDAT